MIEALWSVLFVSNEEIWGSGVVVLETNRVLGGDSQYFYVGDYKIANGILSAEVQITHYSGEANTVFGEASAVKISVSGTANTNEFILSGHVVGSPEKLISIHCTCRAELP